jgi:putative long chain acyl-CoA synthase
VGGRTLAVAAFTVREGRPPRLTEIAQAFDELPPALRPDLVQVVADIPLGSSYRPNAEALSAAGLPKPGTRVWYLDPGSQQYKRLTKAIAAEFQDGSAGVPAGAR